MGSLFTEPISSVVERLIDYRGKTPPKSEEGVRLITAKVIKNGTILDDRAEYITEETYSKWMTRGMPQTGDVLITTEAPLGEVARLKTAERIGLAQRVILLRANPEKADATYFFYALQSPFVQSGLTARSTGTTVAGIKQSELRKVEIPLFELETQQQIAAILSAYDDLIENNTRRIKVLEEMAGLIYREWFVNFRFPGHEGVRMAASELGEIPEGWAFLPVGELLEHYVGGGWGKEASEEKYTLPAYVIRGTDVPEARHGGTKNVPLRYHTDSNLRSRRLKEGDIVFEVSGGSKDQPVGRALLVNAHLLGSFDEDVMCASFCKLLRTKAPTISPEHFYLHVQEIYDSRKIEQYEVQSTGIKNFKFNVFLTNELLAVAPPDLESQFQTLVAPIFESIQLLGSKNQNLRRTRDLLLPKLISGELSVSRVGDELLKQEQIA